MPPISFVTDARTDKSFRIPESIRSIFFRSFANLMSLLLVLHEIKVCLLELLQRRQLLYGLQPEILQKLICSPVEYGPSDCILPPPGPYEPALLKGVEDAVNVDAPYRLYLGAGQGLPVGDDRQRLEGRPGEPLGKPLIQFGYPLSV